MKSPRVLLAVLAAGIAAASIAGPARPALAQFKMVGGAQMYETMNIIQNAQNSQAHSTMMNAVRAAGLVETLSGPGPFTLFAPTNDAFAKLPPGTIETLLKPESKAMLTKILTCHIVAGTVLAAEIDKLIADNKGTYALKTVGGCVLQARRVEDRITLTDENGNVATVRIADVKQSNGVIHVINGVMLPKK